MKGSYLGTVTTPSTKMLEESKENDGPDMDQLDLHDDLGQADVRILNTMGNIEAHDDDNDESMPFGAMPAHNTESMLGPNIDAMINIANDPNNAARVQSHTEFRKITKEPSDDDPYDNFSFQPNAPNQVDIQTL